MFLNAETLARWAILLTNTAIVAGGAALLATSAGAVGGWLIARTDLPGRRLLRILLALLAAQPLVATVTLLLAVQPLWTLPATAWMAGLLYGVLLTPLCAALCAAGLSRGDATVEEQALLDAGPWRVLWRVLLPQRGGLIAATATLVLVLVGTDLTIVDLLRVRTFAEEVYTQFALDRAPGALFLLTAPWLLLFALLIVPAFARFRGLAHESPEATARPAPRYRLGPAGPSLALLYFTLVAGGAALVVARLCAVIGDVAAGWMAFLAIQGELWRSLLLAGGAALVILAVTWIPARLAARGGWRSALLLLGALLLMALPAPLAGVWLIAALDRPGLLGVIYDSPAALVIGLLLRFGPVALLLLTPLFWRVPRELMDAVQLDGGSWLAIERHVILPAVRPALPTVAFVLALLCLGEVGMSVLLAPPGFPTAAIRLFTLLHFGVYRDAAVLSLALLLAATALWIAWTALARRGGA